MLVTVHHGRYIVVLLWLILCHADALAVGGPRPFSTDDLFRLEHLADLSFSPDGKWLTYVIKRPKSTSADHKMEFLDGNDRGDIWLVPTKGGKPRNLTLGAADGSGYWSPVWSPDSQRLAMLSTKGGNVRVWVWEMAARQLRRASDRGVERWPRPVWLTASQLALVVLPEGKKPLSMTIERQAAEVAIREWPKARKGKEVTSNVLESGVPVTYDKRPQGQLLLFDAREGKVQVVTDGNIVDLRVSPDGRHLALIKQVDIVRPDPKRLIQDVQDSRCQLTIMSAQGKERPVRPINVRSSCIYGSIRWSPDGSELAVIRRENESTHVYRYKLPSQSEGEVTGGDLHSSDTAWTFSSGTGVVWSPKRNLVVLRDQSESPASEGLKRRLDWWLIEESGNSRNLTRQMRFAPTQLVPESNSDSFVGVVDGDLWRVGANGSAENVTESFEPKITSLIWPTPRTAEVEQFGEVIISSSQGTTIDLYWVDLRSGQVTPMAKPAPEAEFATFTPAARMVIYTADTRNGTNLWISTVDAQKAHPILETNTFLRDVAEGQIKRIQYRSLDGQELNAWMILPISYRKGKRYPIVVWVYPGIVAGDVLSRTSYEYLKTRLNSANSLNLQLLAARGYAVLLPSMPLKAQGEPSDPYMELTKGVLPAVDRTIELGYADPKRVGLMGQSFGGYGTYGLVTQTNRFQAAVAMAGLSDLISLYGIFDARFRYDEFPHEQSAQMWLAEAGPIRMGSPPWKDAGRYLRNSPIFYVDRVETPLMIVQGDMDYVAMQQGEEFFAALYRQAKRAQFVRYWGEGHVLNSPANIRDMWYRTFAWFDEFLDVLRDQQGNLLWDRDKGRSRNGALPLKPEDFARFDELVLKKK